MTNVTWPLKSGPYTTYKQVVYETDRGRIIFHEQEPYDLFPFKDDIKSMQGAKWDGKNWSVKDCPRNHIQLDFLAGKNPLEWFDRPVQKFEYKRDLAGHQLTMSNAVRTYHYQILAAVPGAGKTLSCIEALEAANLTGEALWSCPARNIEAIEAEFYKWNLNVPCQIVSHAKLKNLARDGFVPQFLVLDESHKFKTANTRRTSAAQFLADATRAKYGFDGYVLALTGTFSPNEPIDPWAQAEIAYPGFLKEGSPKALLRRLANLKKAAGNNGFYEEILNWKEDEVELMFVRMKGLITTIFDEDLDWVLPDMEFIRRNLQPDEATTRVARSIARTCPSAATAAMKLREISDGFNYIQEEDGMTSCPACKGQGTVTEWIDPDNEERSYKSIEMFSPEVCAKFRPTQVICFQCKGEKEVVNYKKIAYEVPCPKEEALREELRDCEEVGRVLIFAGFTGSLDRCVRVAKEEGWTIIRCDGRGFRVLGKRGEKPLRFWMDTESNKKVAYIAHPESGATAFTLTEANVVIFYSNTHRHDHRQQGLKRVHRPGQTRTVKIIDLCHLPTDYRVLDVLDNKKKLEGMTLGEFLGDAFE